MSNLSGQPGATLLQQRSLPPLPPLPRLLPVAHEHRTFLPEPERVSPTATWLNNFLLEPLPHATDDALFARDVVEAGIWGCMAAGPRAAPGSPPYSSPVAASAAPYQVMQRLLAGLQQWIEQGPAARRDEYRTAAVRALGAWLLQEEDLDWSCLDLESMPAVIGSLTRLRTLNVRQNRLHGVPPEIVRLRGLCELDVSHNPLTALPNFLRTMSSLHVYRDPHVRWRDMQPH
jgi:Leucine-rich repeat (LRR) protein